MSLLTPAIARIVRFVLPEGAVVLTLLAFPALSGFGALRSWVPFLFLSALAATVFLGWRFRRGQLFFGAIVIGLSALLTLLPSETRSLALALVSINLAGLALLPERGVLSLGGALRALALLAQVVLLMLLPSLTLSAPPPVELPGLPPIPALWLGHGAALAILAALALVQSDALPRGLFWATAALVAGAGGIAGTAGLPWIAETAGVMGTAGTAGAMEVRDLAAVGAGGWTAVVALASLLVAAVEETHRLAYHDGLTGLPSRRALDERLRRLVGRYTVAMVDVDHFKKFNDRHGHDVGDQVLRLVATRLQATSGARAYRYGGEEFALVFRSKTLEEVTERLEATRRDIAERPFVVRGADRPARKPKHRLMRWRERPTLTVTVSVGAAQRAGWRQSPDEVIQAADRALYRAKEQGRNRVIA